VINLPYFVSCCSSACKAHKSCGRFLFAVDEEDDFLGRGLCLGTKGDPMFFPKSEGENNLMAKLKVAEVVQKRKRKTKQK